MRNPTTNPKRRMHRIPGALFMPAACTLALSIGCGEQGTSSTHPSNLHAIAMETRADTVAMQVLDAYGGQRAWSALRYLRFDFAAGRDTARQVLAHHLWDRMTGDYRVEMPRGGDSTFVVLFNVNTGEGHAYLSGQEVPADTGADLLEQAQHRFINDTYWLLMPVKLFDPGVNRTRVADSSMADHDMLHLAFHDVGMTPGDRYWITVDRENGRIVQWRYHLQSDDPDRVRDPFSWVAHKTLDTPHGTIVVSEQKRRPDGFVLFTDQVAVPETVPDDAFTEPQPML